MYDNSNNYNDKVYLEVKTIIYKCVHGDYILYGVYITTQATMALERDKTVVGEI